MGDQALTDVAPSRLKTTKAFVGLGGTHNTITVRREPDRIVLGLCLWAYLLVIVTTALFGPVLLALLWLRPAGVVDLTQVPILLSGLILALPLFCCVLFVHSLFSRPRIEFRRDSGDLSLYKSGSKPFRRVKRHQIRHFAISQEWYRPSRSRPVPNFVLSVVCCDGSEIALCKTTNQALLQDLVSAIEGQEA